MEKAGSISKTDVSQLTAQRASDEYNVVAQQTNLRNYTRQLKQLLQITGDEDFEVAVPSHLTGDALSDIPGLQTVYDNVGARGIDILNQFLIEAVMLSVTGGIIGVLLGVGASYAIKAFAHWPIAIEPWTIIMSFAVCTFTGVFFGWYPAKKAAQLDPIEAIRYE